MMVGMYYISAAIVTGTQDYNFILSPLFVLKEVGLISISAIPMLAFFWLLAVCIQTPIFSIGIGLASIVPSVLMINTKSVVCIPDVISVFRYYFRIRKTCNKPYDFTGRAFPVDTCGNHHHYCLFVHFLLPFWAGRKEIKLL